ncbi:hypothetical protein MMC17_004277 [Xylographa soralifera]|nr:hypothetical protein [Xylographa soralifera]
MTELTTETVEPDPSATSIANDETVNAGDTTTKTTMTKSEDIETTNKPAPISDEVKTVAGGSVTEDTTDSAEKDVTVKTEGHAISHSAKEDDTLSGKTTTEEQSQPAKATELTNDVGTKENQSTDSYNASGDRGSHPNRGNRGGKNGNHSNRPYINYSDNVKSDLTSQEESSDPVAIRKQVEFYFSDSNLHMDQFLFSKVEGHKNCPVPLSIVHSFKRMRHFQPYSAVVAALKESTILDLVDGDSAVQRKVPLAEELQDKDHREVKKVYEDKAMAQSVYVKGFGAEKPSTQFDIEAFFTPFGPVNSVRLRRTERKEFKGSVFVEFDSAETAKDFLNLESKPKFEGKDLMIKSKKQYCDEKVDDINKGKIRRSNENSRQHKGGGGDKDWRERRTEDQKRGFKDDRKDRGHKGFGSGRGRGRGSRGGFRDRNDEKHRQRNDREVPKVAVSTEDPPVETQVSEIANVTNGDNTSAKNSTSAAIEKVVQDQPESSKKRPHVEDTSADVQPSAKKADTKSEVDINSES